MNTESPGQIFIQHWRKFKNMTHFLLQNPAIDVLSSLNTYTVKTDWLKRPKKNGCLDASETTSLNWLL